MNRRTVDRQPPSRTSHRAVPPLLVTLLPSAPARAGDRDTGAWKRSLRRGEDDGGRGLGEEYAGEGKSEGGAAVGLGAEAPWD